MKNNEIGLSVGDSLLHTFVEPDAHICGAELAFTLKATVVAIIGDVAILDNGTKIRRTMDIYRDADHDHCIWEQYELAIAPRRLDMPLVCIIRNYIASMDKEGVKTVYIAPSEVGCKDYAQFYHALEHLEREGEIKRDNIQCPYMFTSLKVAEPSLLQETLQNIWTAKHRWDVALSYDIANAENTDYCYHCYSAYMNRVVSLVSEMAIGTDVRVEVDKHSLNTISVKVNRNNSPIYRKAVDVCSIYDVAKTMNYIDQLRK